jgi:hypothetical protein
MRIILRDLLYTCRLPLVRHDLEEAATSQDLNAVLPQVMNGKHGLASRSWRGYLSECILQRAEHTREHAISSLVVSGPVDVNYALHRSWRSRRRTGFTHYSCRPAAPPPRLRSLRSVLLWARRWMLAASGARRASELLSLSPYHGDADPNPREQVGCGNASQDVRFLCGAVACMGEPC